MSPVGLGLLLLVGAVGIHYGTHVIAKYWGSGGHVFFGACYIAGGLGLISVSAAMMGAG